MAGTIDAAGDGFSWTGTLDDTDIRSLYAACHSLRFSGRLQLNDGPQRAEVLFVAGEPVEIDGGDTQRIALWSKGTFRAIQGIPSLNGELTSKLEITGSLADTKPSQLWAWVSEYRLTCQIELERPGSKAVVDFKNGHAESAQVNGMPELAALARVSSWTDGSFHVKLRPLFVDGVIPVAPVLDGAPPPDPRQFDVSRSIPMDLRNKPPTPEPKVIRPPTPPLGELAMGEARFTNGDRSQSTMPLPPGKIAPPPVPEVEPEDFELPKTKSGKGVWIVTTLLVLAAGGAGALYYFHLPPFSPPPKPIADEVKPAEAKPGEAARPDETKAATPTETAKTDETKPATPTEAKPGEATPGETKPTTATETKPAETKPTATDETKEPKSTAPEKAEKTDEEKPLSAKAKANAEKAEKLIAKARQLMVEGHEHTGLDTLKKAEKLATGKLAGQVKIYEQQALGKMGKAELLIEGKLPVTVDGHVFHPPRKLKLAAGPHEIDTGDGASEVMLKRGEKKKLKGSRK